MCKYHTRTTTERYMGKQEHGVENYERTLPSPTPAVLPNMKEKLTAITAATFAVDLFVFLDTIYLHRFSKNFN
jgi:hypothetical protein